MIPGSSQQSCNCKKGCINKKCGCRGSGLECSKFCKCFDCTNRGTGKESRLQCVGLTKSPTPGFGKARSGFGKAAPGRAFQKPKSGFISVTVLLFILYNYIQPYLDYIHLDYIHTSIISTFLGKIISSLVLKF